MNTSDIASHKLAKSLLVHGIVDIVLAYLNHCMYNLLCLGWFSLLMADLNLVEICLLI